MYRGRDPEPLALEAYETLAESYAAAVDTKPHNAYYDRPATTSLLPDVRGKRVLDAGCGPGVYAELLVDRGAAQVLALDVSEKMVRLAKERLGAKAGVMRADLGQPLDFLEDTSFDVVLSALALDYVRDWDTVFAEFHRVLKPGGRFIFSMEHPTLKFAEHPETNYFDTEVVRMEWRGFDRRVNMPSYRRPLEAVVTPLLNAGFVLERLLEAKPTEEFHRADPAEYEELSRRPGFLCIRAAKR